MLTHNQQLYNSDAYINGPRIQQYNTFPAAQEYQEEQYLSRVEMEFIRGCVDHQKKVPIWHNYTLGIDKISMEHFLIFLFFILKIVSGLLQSFPIER